MNKEARYKLAARCVRLARVLTSDGWPSKVKEGGLRKAMGLKTDQPLAQQASPGDVIKFFKSADAEGRGMVMFAVNSNKGPFWKQVAAGIGKGSKESSEKMAIDDRARDLKKVREHLLDAQELLYMHRSRSDKEVQQLIAAVGDALRRT